MQNTTHCWFPIKFLDIHEAQIDAVRSWGQAYYSRTKRLSSSSLHKLLPRMLLLTSNADEHLVFTYWFGEPSPQPFEHEHMSGSCNNECHRVVDQMFIGVA
jgi:hypothetical protein